MDTNSLFPSFDSNETYPLTFQYDNYTLEIDTKKEWQIITEESVFVPYLINKSLIVLKVKGTLTPRLLNQMGEKIYLILCFQGVSKFIAISDFSNVTKIGISNPFDWFSLVNTTLSKVRAHEYIVPCGKIKSIFIFHRIALKIFRKKSTTLVGSIEQGIKNALAHLPNLISGNDSNYYSERFPGGDLQSLRIKQLLNAINNLSWGQEVDSNNYNLPPNDPFKDLFTAFQGLQKEVKYVLNKTASLNQTLESLVMERTQKLLKQSRRLQTLNEQLDRYIYSASHELRAPVVSMLGLLELLELDHDSSEKQVYINLLRDTINKQDRVLKQIIQIRENNKSVPRKHKIEFNDLIEEVASELGFNRKGIQVNLKINVNQTKPFYSDKSRLKTIIYNLLKNAYQYSEGENINIDAVVKRKRLTLTVEDFGEGISPDSLPHIFDIFYRASESKSGAGLGLFTVKEMVNSLSGNVEVESKLNVGTKFTIVLPSLIAPPINISNKKFVEKPKIEVEEIYLNESA